MLGLPKSTEVNKQLAKSMIYTKFKMNTKEKAEIDEDISKITIINEVTATKINVAEGENVKSFFVLLIQLKRKDFDEKTIIKISKLIPQNMLLILEYDKKAKLATYNTRLIHSDWNDTENLSIELNGLNLDDIWEKTVMSLEGGVWNEELSLEENIILREKREKLQKEIAKLEKQARSEKQPRKKFDLVQKINELKNEFVKI